MDKTTQDIINLYSHITNLGLQGYISQYHKTLILRWDDMLRSNDYTNDEYKSIRNILYGLFVLLADSSNSRNTSIDFCLETIKTHNDNSIYSQYTTLRDVFDNFDNINNMQELDYSYVIQLLMSLYNGAILYHDRGSIHRHIALVLRKYDMCNKYLNGVVNPTTKHEIDIDDVVLSIYGK